MKKGLIRTKLSEVKHSSRVRAVSSRTGRSYNAVIQDMRTARDEYGISFKDYDVFGCEECRTKEDLEEKSRKIRKQKRMINYLCEETGWSKEKSAEELKKVKEKYGIEAKTYIRAGLYSKDDAGIAKYLENEKTKELKGNPQVTKVAKRSGRPYEDVLEDMMKARDEYGITFAQYEVLGGENCNTAEDFNKLKEDAEILRNQKRERAIRNLCRVTDCTPEEAERKIIHVIERFGLSDRQYYNLGYYLLDDDGIREALNEEKKTREEVQAKVAAKTGWDMPKIENHMKYVSLQYGIDAIDYYIIKGWRLSDEEFSKLARSIVVKTLSRKYNKKRSLDKLTNKLKFDRAYSDCLGRRFWTNDEDADFESYCTFWDGMDEAMLKPINLSKARGIGKIPKPEDLKKAYDEIKDGPHVLLEEVVKQHSAINAIYSQSVNTVRMVTVLKDDEFHVVSSFMRFGKGGTVVDNMFAGGMIAGVDEINGIVDTGAVDRDGNAHDCHPDTGKQIKGFKIPNYDKVLEITEKALRKYPDINFVGWDVAVTKDGAVIIEGNSRPDPMAYQLPYMQPPLNEPKLYKYEPYL